MQRDLWFGVLTATAVLGTENNLRVGAKWGLGILAVIFASILCHRFLLFEHGNADEYPVRAVAFVRDHALPGPLFNDFDWGGYLIWALPEHPVAIDGRTNLYGSDRVLRNYRTLIGEGDWENDPDLTSARLVILSPKKWPLVDLLRQSDDWAVAYEDKTAVVFRR